MDDPSALVVAFIADYFRWNEAAHERSEKAGCSEIGIAKCHQTAPVSPQRGGR